MRRAENDDDTGRNLALISCGFRGQSQLIRRMVRAIRMLRVNACVQFTGFTGRFEAFCRMFPALIHMMYNIMDGRGHRHQAYDSRQEENCGNAREHKRSMRACVNYGNAPIIVKFFVGARF